MVTKHWEVRIVVRLYREFMGNLFTEMISRTSVWMHSIYYSVIETGRAYGEASCAFNTQPTKSVGSLCDMDVEKEKRFAWFDVFVSQMHSCLNVLRELLFFVYFDKTFHDYSIRS